MTLYLDSSAIIKLYIDEQQADDVRNRVAAADAIATSTVAYAEVRSALARIRAETRRSAASTAAIAQFDRDWSHFLSFDVDASLAREAGMLADRFRIRGFDAIHLATFARMLERIDDDLEFLAFDQKLNAAARRLGDE